MSNRTVEDWRYTANRWPEGRREEGVSFTVHRILASVVDEDERWAAIEDAPFNPRTGARQWTPDGAKRIVGQRGSTAAQGRGVTVPRRREPGHWPSTTATWSASPRWMHAPPASRTAARTQ
ncbi:DUF6192 family protein [Streptomyces canus]|uniref:DUF6192 family protein n=1 Tax=Streptomyces canus TaxID=58343 RepID=UPI0033E3BA3D